MPATCWRFEQSPPIPVQLPPGVNPTTSARSPPSGTSTLQSSQKTELLGRRVSVAAGRQDRRWCTQREAHVAVLRLSDFPLHVGLLGHVRPIRNHGHHALGANANEDVSFIAKLSAHHRYLS